MSQTSTAKCIQLCMSLPRATNSLSTIARKRRECRSLFKLRLKSGGESAGLFSSLHQLGCANTHRYSSRWNNAAYLRIHPGCVMIALASATCWCICSYGDIFSLTLMLLFFPLLSTRLRPPASPGGSGCSEGPRSFNWSEQCCFWPQQKNL